MLNKLKDVGMSALNDAFDKISTTSVRDIYDAGLPDVSGPKSMLITFMKDRVEITYKDFIILSRKIIIKPDDILELEFGVQNTDTTGNAIKGAITGNLLMGGLGAVAMAGLASKQRKEDSLHLVINYKGEPRPLHFQNTKKSQKLYQKFKKVFALRTPIKNTPKSVTTIVNTGDVAKQLSDLNNLVQQGILTQTEFEIQKQKILSAG